MSTCFRDNSNICLHITSVIFYIQYSKSFNSWRDSNLSQQYERIICNIFKSRPFIKPFNSIQYTNFFKLHQQEKTKLITFPSISKIHCKDLKNHNTRDFTNKKICMEQNCTENYRNAYKPWENYTKKWQKSKIA